MICTYTVSKFCRDDISLIENYSEAIKDTNEVWHCHHRDEIRILPSGIKVIRSRNELIESGRYYNCPANELIFMRVSDHRRLHMLGHKISEKLRTIFSNAGKRNRHDNFKGHMHSDKTKEQIRAKLKGRKLKIIDGKRTYYFPEVLNAN